MYNVVSYQPIAISFLHYRVHSMSLKMLEGTVPTTLSHRKIVHQTKKKKKMLGKCPQNTTLLAVYLHYRIASYPFLHPAPTHRFSSSLCPRATTSFVPLRTKGQTSRCIGLLPSPMYSRSQTMFPEREKCEFLSCVQHFTTL